jgi:hypothetical protein
MTRGEIKSHVRGWLGIPLTDTRRLPETTLHDCITDAIESIATRRNWPFLLTQMTPPASLTAGQWQVILPDDFARPFLVFIKSGAEEPFEPKAATYEELIAAFPDPANSAVWGTPSAAALVGRTMLAVGPPAQGAISVLCHYYKFPAVLADDDDENEVTTNLARAVKWFATAEAADYIFESQRGDLARAKGEKALDEVEIDLTDAARLNQTPQIEEP